MIRMLSRSDAAAYRELRLQALHSDPQAFLSTFELEHQRPAHHFEYEVAGAITGNCFGYYGVFDDHNSEKLIGFCQAAPSYLPKQAHVAFLYNLYIDPHYRQQGLARKLLLHIFECLRKTEIEIVLISHLSSNDRAHRLYQELGFQETGKKVGTVKWQGHYDDEVDMSLRL